MIYDSKFWFPNYICVLKNDDKCLLASRNDDKRVYLSLEAYELLFDAINNENSVRDFLDSFEIEEDYKYMCSILERLIENRVLVQENELKEYAYEEASLILTNRCNLSCIHCCQSANENANEELDIENWKSLIDIIKNLGVKSITVTGGEPLLRNDIEQISTYLRKNYDGHLTLLTNGVLVNEENITCIIETYNHISISLDGCNEEMTRFIRGEGVYEKVLNTIYALHRRDFYNISLSAILPNSDEVEKEFELMCENLNVKPQIRYLTKMGRASQNFGIMQEHFHEYVVRNNYNEYIFETREDIASLYACAAIGKRTLTIGPNGKFYPCNLLQEKDFEFNSINKNAYNEEFEKLIKFKGTICEECCVNVFCWSCISDFALIRDDEQMLRKRCELKKNNLVRRIWGNVYVDDNLGNNSM